VPTRLCDLVGIGHPIVQAPDWGAATPELAAAVSEAGAARGARAQLGNTTAAAREAGSSSPCSASNASSASSQAA
jgi:NAD(P)H-dependent flavin oxidoreductase YrpB (nitropropane dioxygenase family)